MIFKMAGGLGLFLFGMKLMSEGLQKAAGQSLKIILEKLTTNRLIGTLVGVVVTAIIQSSSATTVMVVGFVNAGLMNLAQALSVVLGANVGTTVTAQLIAFKIGALALPAIGVGVFLKMFTKNQKYKYFSDVLIGFGILFLGLDIMKNGFVPLRQSEGFREAFITFSSNPFLAVCAGAILTLIVQSSSATIGITIALASTGLIDFYAASALVLGENIGTTITANLAAIGTNITARRAAFGHLLINTLGVLYMLILLKYFTTFIDFVTPGDPSVIEPGGTNLSIARHIANLHTFFNFINIIVFLPLISFLVTICEKVIKGKNETSDRLIYLDDRLIDTPSLAIPQAVNEVRRMSEMSYEMVLVCRKIFETGSRFHISRIYEMEDTVDHLEKDIQEYLVNLLQKAINEQDIEAINHILYVLHDLEKIADYSENIARQAEKLLNLNLTFSDDAQKDLYILFDVVLRFSETTIDAYNEGYSPRKLDLEDENEIDRLRAKYKKEHMERLHKGICGVEIGIIYVDILNNLEKIGDHTFNIAKVVNGDV